MKEGSFVGVFDGRDGLFMGGGSRPGPTLIEILSPIVCLFYKN